MVGGTRGTIPTRSGWWGVPSWPGRDGVPPTRSGWGTPQPGLDGGVPQVPLWPGLDGVPPRQNSIVSTCYTAGSVTLALMQEDFLVIIFTAREISMTEGNVCLSTLGGGRVPHYHPIILQLPLVSCPFWGWRVPSPSHNISTDPRSLPRGTLSRPGEGYPLSTRD